MAKQNMIVFSYFPFLYPEDVPDMTKSDIQTIFDAIGKHQEKHPTIVEACLWAETNGEAPSPVFVMDGAREVADHLTAWSEGKPGEWFDLCVLDHGDIYFVILWPNLLKSKDRHIYNWLLTREEIIVENNTDFLCCFKALYFRSTGRGVLDKLQDKLRGSTASVGFLDVKDFNKENPIATEAVPHFIGPFKLRLEHLEASKYCTDIIMGHDDREVLIRSS